MTTRRTRLAAAVAVGLAVVAPALSVLLTCAPVQAAYADETPARIAEAWTSDPVFVSPDATIGLTDADLAQLHADVEASPTPLYVAVLHDLPPGQATTTGLARRLSDQVDAATGTRPWIVVYADDTLPAFGGSFAGDGDHDDRFVSAGDAVATDRSAAAGRLLTLTGRLAGRVALPPGLFDLPGATDEPTAVRVRVSRVVVAATAALVVLGIVAAALWWGARGGAGVRRTWLLRRAVEEGTEADRSVRARREVLALGTGLDDADLAPDDDLTQWQTALDSYDRASRLLDRATGTEQLDAVLDECAAGRTALAAADGGHRAG